MPKSKQPRVMDIRSFFQKKKPKVKPTESSNNQNNDNGGGGDDDDADTKAVLNNDRAKSKTNNNSKNENNDSKPSSKSSSSSFSSGNRRKRLVIKDDDDEDDYEDKGNNNDNDIVDCEMKDVAAAATAKENYENEQAKETTKTSSSSLSSTPSKRKSRMIITESLNDEEENENVKKEKEDEQKDNDIIHNKSPRRSPRKKLKSTTHNHKDKFEDNDDVNMVVHDTARARVPTTKNNHAPTVHNSETIDLLNDDDDNDNTHNVTSTTTTTNSQSRRKSSSSSTTTTTTTTTRTEAPLQPLRTIEQSEFDADKLMPECLKGYTFVLTGVLDNLSREDATDLIKTAGGRVTGSVSGKTDYLVVGELLEDGRPYTEGSKYLRALKQQGTIIVKGEQALFGLIQQYSDKMAKSTKSSLPSSTTPKHTTPTTTTTTSSRIKTNPYARKTTATAKPNPYAKSTGGPPPPETAIVHKQQGPATSTTTSTSLLWVDKYKPVHSKDILGNQDAVTKLTQWLRTWEDNFNHAKAVGKAFSSPKGPWKAALLSGPPGIGKTTTATLVAKEAGRDLIEFNASDVRSKKALQTELGDITGSRTIEFASKGRQTANNTNNNRTKRCIIMDEVDGMGAGDRSGISELIQMIKHSRVPIICICNDRQSQKLKSLVPYCMDLRYRRPTKAMIAQRAMAVAAKEGLNVEQNAAEAIAESCGNDVRQVLNCLQMWSSSSSSSSAASSMTYKGWKDRERAVHKDEILRVNLFEATRRLLEGRRGLAGVNDTAMERDHFMGRNDAFFVDYNFTGLLVQQNYIKVIQGQFNDAKRSGDQSKVLSVLERMHEAADSMSDFAHTENALRGGQNWGLLPLAAALTVKTGYHAGGENGAFFPGFPDFTTWLGKNSTKGKKQRLLQELQHHMNYRISGGNQEMRMSYLPVLRSRLLLLLTGDKKNAANNEARVQEAIKLMDEYGLDRDDVLEKLDEFKMNPKDPDFNQLLDSKQKSAFTRVYNQGVHKSQALVSEQGAPKKSKRAAGTLEEGADLDVINDDDQPDEKDEDDEDDDELNADKIKALFQKKGRKAAAGSKNKAATGKTTTSKRRKKG